MSRKRHRGCSSHTPNVSIPTTYIYIYIMNTGTAAETLFADCHNVTGADISESDDDDDSDHSTSEPHQRRGQKDHHPNRARGPATCVASSETKEIVARLTGLMNGTENVHDGNGMAGRVRKGNKKKRRKNLTRR
jgi:hypothetical protein